jgi:hypothetical protein
MAGLRVPRREEAFSEIAHSTGNTYATRETRTQESAEPLPPRPR